VFIKAMSVENVKSFRGEQIFRFVDGLNFLVGDNNSGKSTVFEALLFLFSGPTATSFTPATFYSKDADGPTRVSVDLCGGIDELVATEKFARLADYAFEDDDGQTVLRLERNSSNREVAQGSRTVTLDVKKLCFWNPSTSQFENPTGIDALAKSILDLEPVWADASPEDHVDFGTTKTLGRLLDAAFKRFALTSPWTNFVAAHKDAFSAGDQSFAHHAEGIANEIAALVGQQYGPAAVRFDFSLPDAAIFTKLGNLIVDDGAGETLLAGKGTGMQRALTLSVIQLYAKSEAIADEANPKPLILLLDEPETWLHPNAQLRLADALCAIGEREQVFIVTHSPYLIRKFRNAEHKLIAFTGQGVDRSIRYAEHMGLLGPGEPTWGEINYEAFGICSHEFHNELYGFVHRYLEIQTPEARIGEREIDTFLESNGLVREMSWIRTPQRSYPVTLPVYVRNCIHHPENTNNSEVTDSQFEQSTGALVALVKTLL
jgi:putative ATP-dependent endonuclease of OLD family